MNRSQAGFGELGRVELVEHVELTRVDDPWLIAKRRRW
jgi:hypothetical protein